VERAEKREEVASLAKVFEAASFVLVSRNGGLTVADVNELRRRMRAAGASYRVAKNRLASLALKGTRFQGISPMLKGPTALAWSADPVAVAKVAVEFAKDNDKLVIVGGALGERTLDAEGVKALASLPSLDELRGKIAGTLKAPAGKLASLLQAPAGKLARVFAAYGNKEGGAAA